MQPTFSYLVLPALELSLDKLQVHNVFDGNVTNNKDELSELEGAGLGSPSSHGRQGFLARAGGTRFRLGFTFVCLPHSRHRLFDRDGVRYLKRPFAQILDDGAAQHIWLLAK
jgi:hypothetical protein